VADVADALPDNHVVLVRRHPLLLDDAPPTAGRVYDVSEYPDVTELMLIADVLISDYSSVVADFASTGRPILLLAPDLDVFREIVGLSVDYDAVMPGPVLSSPDQAVAAIHDLARVSSDHRGRYEAFADKFCDLDDGKAAARVVDWMLAAAG
jgi:CDP-glycerol glycerophosphotransferase